MPRTCHEIIVFTPEQIRALVLGTLVPDEPDAAAAAEVVERWLYEVLTKPLPPLCLNCDAEMWAVWHVAVAMPFSSRKGRAIVSCICPHCATVSKDELLAMLVRQFGVVLPDAQRVEPGHG